MLKAMLHDVLSLMNVMNNLHVSWSGIKNIFICSQIGVTVSRSGFTTFSSSRTGITANKKKSRISNLINLFSIQFKNMYGQKFGNLFIFGLLRFGENPLKILFPDRDSLLSQDPDWESQTTRKKPDFKH